MIVVPRISGKNVIYFKEFEAVLNQNKLTFVRGRNNDSSHTDPTGNGAGKSLLFSTIPNLYYFSPPLAVRKKAKKELLGKNTEICVEQVVGDVHHRIVQRANGYEIFKNGTDLQVRTTPLQEEYIRGLFPLTEVEFYSFCWVSTQKPFLLQQDTDANRLHHLSNIFRLNEYSEYHAYFESLRRNITKQEDALALLKQKRQALKAKLEAIPKQDPKRKAKLTAEMKRLDAERQQLVRSEADAFALLEKLRKLLKIEQSLDALRLEYKYPSSPKDQLKILARQRSAANAWSSYRRELKTYQRTWDSLSAQMDAIQRPDVDRKALRVEYKTLQSRLTLLDEQLKDAHKLRDRFDTAQAEYQELRSSIKELGITSDRKLADVEADISNVRTTLRLRKLLEHQHSDDSTCPTCLSTIDFKNVKKLVVEADKRYPKLQAEQKYLTLSVELDKARTRMKAAQRDMEGLDIDVLERKRKKNRARTSEILAEVNALDRYEDLQRQLGELQKPQRPNEVEPELSIDQIEEAVELCNNILRQLSAKEALISGDADLRSCKKASAVKKRIAHQQARVEELEAEARKVATALGEVSEELSKYSNSVRERELYEKELKELRDEIAEIEPKLLDKPVLDGLVKAYSTKGLKTVVANDLSQLIEANLNLYRELVFKEKFSFTTKVSSTGMSILVNRGNGVVSDVRNLSGAESNCFRLLFLTSALPLIPSERRTNFLFLDEPTSHQDEPSRELVIQQFLPAIQELVPNVYVTTPNPSDHLQGANEWLVVKEKGVSRLECVS